MLPSSAHHPTKTSIILTFHLTTIWQPFVGYRTPAFIIPHRTRVVNPQVAARRSYQLHFWFNHAPTQPSHHSPLSVHQPLLTSRSLVGPLPCSSSTLPHINTNIPSSKQTPSCIHNFHCTSTELTTHLSLLTATLLLGGDIQPNPGSTHPANLLISTLNTRSMLTPEHVTALNDLTDTTNPTSSHILKHGFVAPRHLLSYSTPHLLATLFSLLSAPTSVTHLNPFSLVALPS